MDAKEELAIFSRKVYEKGFVAATDGNLSSRIDNNFFLITPSATCKGDVTINNVLTIDVNNNLVAGAGKVSTEAKLHTYIYAQRLDVNAIIHAHPIYSTAFAFTDKKLDVSIAPEIVLTLGRIPHCKYATPSTDEVTKSINECIEYANVFILSNHGVVVTGKNIKEAYFRLEKLEHYAHTLYLAYQLGGVNKLDESQLQDLYNIAESTYNIKLHKKNRYL